MQNTRHYQSLFDHITRRLVILLLMFFLYNWWIKPAAHYPDLAQINLKTTNTLKDLVRTKFFRIIRINIESECPFWAQQRLCASGGCTVCRCDQKEIPKQWARTDLVQRHKRVQQKVDQWAPQRGQNGGNEVIEKGVWHVEEIENDKGEYFDVDLNKEAYTGYDGGFIWNLIYKQNCFSGKYETMCHEQKVLYKIISGLHASISTHLSYFHKDLRPFLKPEESVYYPNKTQYMNRVGNWSERVDNLYFLYSVLLSSAAKIKDKLLNYTIVSENIEQDLKAKVALRAFLSQLDNFHIPKELQSFTKMSEPYLSQYQRYVHNISRIMDCVQCQKCRLFGKMQTYGLGAAMKITFGYTDLKRNELVAFINTLNKISVSVEINQLYTKDNGDPWYWLRVVSGGLVLYVLKKAISGFRMQTYTERPKSQ